MSISVPTLTLQTLVPIQGTYSSSEIDELDTNGDGVVSPIEAALGGTQTKLDQPNGPPPGGMPPPPPPASDGINAQSLFEALVLTAEEEDEASTVTLMPNVLEDLQTLLAAAQ